MALGDYLGSIGTDCVVNNYKIDKVRSLDKLIKDNVDNYNNSESYFSELYPLIRHGFKRPHTSLDYFGQEIFHEGIELGFDYSTGKICYFPTEDISRNIINVGQPRSGKSAYELMFAYDSYHHTDEICAIFVDNKGEVAPSLSNFKDGSETFLKSKIIELSPSNLPNLYDFFDKDRIIVIDLSVANDSKEDYLKSLLDVMLAIRKSMLQFKKIWQKKDANKPPFTIMIFFEDAWEMFPNSNSTVMKDRYSSNKAYEVKKEAYFAMAKKAMKQGDHNEAERLIEKAKNVPDLVQLTYDIKLMMQKNMQLFGYLGFGCWINIHRFQDIDTNFVTNAGTWIIHDMNYTDFRILNSPKISKSLVKKYFKISQDERERKKRSNSKDSFMEYCLLISPSIQAIIKKPDFNLFHKSENRSLRRRSDTQKVRTLL